MKKRFNIIVTKGAARWDVRVLQPTTSEYVNFDMRKMTSKQRSDFHREFMNAYRGARA